MQNQLAVHCLDLGLLVTAIAAAGAGAAESAPLEGGPFALARSKTMRLAYRGRPLVTGDRFAPLEDLESAETLRVDRRGDVQVLNVIRAEHPELTFRKEVALHPDGALELTVKADYAPFANLPRNYTLVLPLDLFEGAAFRAMGGRTHGVKEYTGTITRGMPQGGLVKGESRVRYIAFKSDKVNLVFDFNPYGVQQMYTDYPFSGEPMGVASVSRVGDTLRIASFPRAGTRAGALCAAKILIYESEFDYDRRHPYRKWGYAGGPKPVVHAAFGATAPGPGIDSVDLRPFTGNNTAGWERAPDSLQLVQGKAKHIYAGCVFSPAGAAATLVQPIKPGVYVITVHAGHPGQDVGPFDIFIDGERVAEDVTAKAGKPTPVIVSRFLRTSPVRMEFKGKSWGVHSVAMQLFIQRHEDYVLDRGLWVIDGLHEPDFGIRKRLPEADRTASLPKVETPPEPRFTRDGLEVLLPAPDNPALAWRRNMRMVSWARSHASTGFEFDTPELVERQVLALKAEGFNTINDGLFFWNLAYTDRWDEGIEMIRMITYFAHKHGMKVIHHCDTTVINYQGTAMQYLMAHPGWMQRDIRYGLPTFSLICLNNPELRRELIGRFVRLAAEAGVDGFMLDEIIFASKDYCGCPHCRAKFTRDTGAVLPADPDSPVFDNYEDPLWVKWIKWRQRCVGDWRLAFRRAFNKVNPDLCFMVYTTHYGLTSRWAPREKGANLIQAARACDFVGTEIMSRNVYESCRAVYSYRKIKTAIGDSLGCSIWGLVYHVDNPTIAYAGWAMNQMNRQTTWMGAIPGVDMKHFLEWPFRVRTEAARSVADVAVLFSSTSRDFAKKFPAISGGLGMSQIMTDVHMQHDVLLEADVRPERLARYKLVVLPSVACTSAVQAAALRQYVERGGTLLVSGNTSLQDENGTFRKTFGLAGLLGLDMDPQNAMIKGEHTFRWRQDKTSVPVPNYAFRVTPRTDARSEILADIVRNGKVVGPALTVNRIGKGACFYLASPLGILNREAETTPGGKWTFQRNRPAADLLLKIIRDAVPDGFDVQAVSVPERVFLSVHSQAGENGEEILIHLLNLTGSGRLKPGQTVSKSTPKNAFPALKEDLVFDLRLGEIAAARILSPDYGGARPVALEARAGGATRVTVEAGDLKAYAIVYLTKKYDRRPQPTGVVPAGCGDTMDGMDRMDSP